MKKMFLLLVMCTSAGVVRAIDEATENTIKKYTAMAVASFVCGVGSEVSNRAVVYNEEQRKTQHAQLEAGIKKLGANPILAGEKVAGSTSKVNHATVALADGSGFSTSNFAAGSNNENFTGADVVKTVKEAHDLLDKKRRELAAYAPDTVFTVPFRKATGETFWLASNYAVCSAIKWGFMDNAEYRNWLKDREKRWYPLPTLNVREIATSIVGHSAGKSVMTGNLTFAFGIGFKDGEFTIGY